MRQRSALVFHLLAAGLLLPQLLCPSASSDSSPVVGLYDVSGYSAGITPVLDTMKLPWKKLTEQDLKDPAVLRSFKVVALIQGYVFQTVQPFPDEVQQALATYVREGGRLYCDYRARPLPEVAGMSGFSENTQGDLKVLTTNHPITARLQEGQILPYSLYGTNPSPSTATPLLGTTTGGYSLIVNQYGKGVCVYSGALLGGKNAGNGGPPAIKQLLAGLFGFLAETPPPSFTVDVSRVEHQIVGVAPESRYSLDSEGFVHNWIVAGPFLPTTTQKPEALFAADFLKPSDAAARPVVGESPATLVRWLEASTTRGANSDVPALDLLKLFPGDGRFAYAGCYLDNPVVQKLKFKVGSDDGFRMWINGRLIGELRQGRAAFPDQNVYEVELPPGRSLALFKVENMLGGFELCLRVTDLNDKPAQSVQPVVLRNPAELAQSKGGSPEQVAEFDPADRVIEVSKTAVAIFREPGFPYSAMPESVTPERVAEACQSNGMRNEFLTAADLTDTSRLTTDRFHTLIMTYGETFPVDALGAIRQFLAEGGRLICPAGVPFSHPVIHQADGWHDDGYSGAICDAVFRRMLPFAWAYGAERTVACAVVLRPDLFPGLPVRWPLTGGTVGFIPKVKDAAGVPFSIGANRKVVVSSTEDGEVAATPIWFLENNPRVLLIGFTGKSHPWNPDAWTHWDKAIAACLRLVTRTPVLALRDLRPYNCSYRDGETVKIDAVVRCTSGPARATQVKLKIRERDSGKTVFSDSRLVDFAAGEERTLTFTWPRARLTTWAYEIVAQAGIAGGTASTDTEIFTAWNEKTIRNAPRLTMKEGIAHLEGKSTRLNGVNLYMDDERGLAMYWGRPTFADGEARWKLTLGLRDLHLGYLAALGGNSVRESYYGSALSPEDFQGRETNTLRAADSFFLLTAGNRFVNQTGPDEFWVSQTPYWRDKFAAAKTTEATGELLSEVNRYCGLFASRYRGFRNLLWEMQNEPDGPDLPTEVERRAQHKDLVPYLTDKRRKIEQAYGRGVFGIQNTATTENVSWDRRVLGSLLDWSAFHPYVPAWTSESSRHNWAFAWNFGRPVIAGEVGYCGPGTIEQLQHYILAEGGLGYSHFYLFEPPWGCPGAAAGREDETEKPITKPFRRYMALQRILRPDRFAPPQSVLVYSHEQRMTDPASFDRLAGLYLDLLRQGVHPWILEGKELLNLPRHGPIFFWPTEVVLSEASKQRLHELVAGKKVTCLAVGPDDGVLPDWVSHSDPTALLVKPLPVGIESGNPDVVYLLPERSGGHTVILVNHKGDRKVTVRAGKHRVIMSVPPESAGTL
ncbi:MAG: hypothetical protein HY318_04865, partial [Armatimonadetes bacterium]|nr:hypothetical protein [Armatimonadota bacterium]